MDKDLKNKWIAALESGDYKKGIAYFHQADRDEYCCLGVLCVIAQIPTHEVGVDNWLGVQGFIGRGPDLKLAAINDSHDTFAPVIDYIKENL